MLVETTLSSVVFRNMSSEPAQPGQAQGAEATGRRRRDPVPLTDPIVMRALAHPVRTALLELLKVLDTVTATQASELLGESPANCAFHLRTLAKYGFAEEAGGGRGRERPWKAANLDIMLSNVQPDPQAALAAGALSRLWLERWMERARGVFESDTFLPGWEHATGWSQNAVFLTPEETQELRWQIRDLLIRYEPRKADSSLRPAGALPVEWMTFASPMAELVETVQAQAQEAAEAQARETDEAQSREAPGHPADPGPEN
jgi:Helix-turn-helix domain